MATIAMVTVMTVVAATVGILVIMTVIRTVVVVVVAVFLVAAVHDGHTVVAIDRPVAVVISNDDALGVDGAAAG